MGGATGHSHRTVATGATGLSRRTAATGPFCLLMSIPLTISMPLTVGPSSMRSRGCNPTLGMLKHSYIDSTSLCGHSVDCYAHVYCRHADRVCKVVWNGAYIAYR